MNGINRIIIKPGLRVSVVLKEDQQKRLAQGIVKDILTKCSANPHGIKIRLESSQVGQVKKIAQ